MSAARTAIALSLLIAMTAIAFPSIAGINAQATLGVTGKPLAQMITTTTVTCNPSPGQQFLCNAVIMNDEVTGGFSTGSVTWTTSGAGSFSPSSVCTVTEDSASTSNCEVYYVPYAGDTQVTITASYSGDPENQPSQGSVTFNVAQTSTSSSTVTTSSQITSTSTSISLSTSTTVLPSTSTSASVDTTTSMTTSSVTTSSTSNLALYVGVIVAIVAVVLIIVFLLMRRRMAK